MHVRRRVSGIGFVCTCLHPPCVVEPSCQHPPSMVAPSVKCFRCGVVFLCWIPFNGNVDPLTYGCLLPVPSSVRGRKDKKSSVRCPPKLHLCASLAWAHGLKLSSGMRTIFRGWRGSLQPAQLPKPSVLRSTRMTVKRDVAPFDASKRFMHA